MNAMLAQTEKLYEESFKEQPRVVSRAPGRVEVLGNHTDYNQGYVLSCAIDKELYVATGPGGTEGTLELVSSHYPETVRITQVEPQSSPSWANYPLGVYAELSRRGLSGRGARIAVHGNVPLGAGLSSSAALEVATALALCRLYSCEVEPVELARLCQKAENSFTGAQCGLLDQFSSLFGKKDHLLFTDFRTLDHRPVPIPEVSLGLVISGVSHSLASSGYNDRREECARAAEFLAGKYGGVRTLRDVSSGQLGEVESELNPVLVKRARHIVGENERVLKGMDLLEEGDLSGFGELLFQSHESSRINYENSCPELDKLVDTARRVDGVRGSRLSGGGWGGATLTVMDHDATDAFAATIKESYTLPSGEEPPIYTASIVDGAAVIKG